MNAKTISDGTSSHLFEKPRKSLSRKTDATYFHRPDELSTPVWFQVAPKLAVQILLDAPFIDRFKRRIFSCEQNVDRETSDQSLYLAKSLNARLGKQSENWKKNHE